MALVQAQMHEVAKKAARVMILVRTRVTSQKKEGLDSSLKCWLRGKSAHI